MADGNGACCLICDLGCPKVSFRIPWLSKLLWQSRVFQSHYRCFLHKKVWIFRAFPIPKRFCLLLILAVCSGLNSYKPQIENSLKNILKPLMSCDYETIKCKGKLVNNMCIYIKLLHTINHNCKPDFINP